MIPSPNKRYLVGPEEVLRKLFPDYKGNDQRILPNGSFLIEVNCTDEQLASLNESIKAFTHEEVIRYLSEYARPAATTESKPKTRKKQ